MIICYLGLRALSAPVGDPMTSWIFPVVFVAFSRTRLMSAYEDGHRQELSEQL